MLEKNEITLCGLKLNNVLMEEALAIILESSIRNLKSYVVTPNLDFFRIADKDTHFKMVINQSLLSLVDGKPVMWISRYYGKKIKQKISGSDLGPAILKLANRNKQSIFLLGGSETISQKAHENVKNDYSDLASIHSYSPKMGFEKDKVEIENIIKLLEQAKPDYVFCCLGTPKQEKFIYNNLEELPEAIYFGLGATIDFLASAKKRAPRWMSNAGFEWLYRLFLEPRRLFKRYILDLMFLFKAFLFRRKYSR